MPYNKNKQKYPWYVHQSNSHLKPSSCKYKGYQGKKQTHTMKKEINYLQDTCNMKGVLLWMIELI